MTSIGKVILGILIIGALYMIPIYHAMGTSYSISALASLCENPIISLLGGSQCQAYKMFFYIGWIVGIVFVAWGLLEHD
jgi:hypothetical protein